jgi:four helix bundle protein
MDSYRSLVAWQRAHALAVTVSKAVDVGYHPRSRALFDQFRRAAISVEANIVEGYALRTPLLFRRHLRIALGSAAESECFVRLAAELQYLPEGTIADLRPLCDGIIRTLVGLLRKAVPEGPRTAHRSPRT